jgi:hypothetical protein
VEEADGIPLELLPLGFVAFDIRQARDAMPLKTAMQRRARQVRDRRLQCAEAVVQRQKRMAPERDDRNFFGFGQNRRARFRRPGLHIRDCRPFPALRHSLGVDPQLLAQLRERSLQLL